MTTNVTKISDNASSSDFAPPKAELKADAPKKKILFVDDEQHVLDGLRRMLKEHSTEWQMDFSASVAHARTLLAECDYDVLVTDLRLPGEDGFDLLREVKGSSRTGGVEVIVLTGLGDDSLKREAVDGGAADLLEKPVQKEDLVARLKSALRVKYYCDTLERQKAQLEQQLFQMQRMELVGELAAGVVHDLKNALNIVSCYSDFLIGRQLPEEKQRSGLESLYRASNYALRIVERIHRLSKPSAAAMARLTLGAVIDDCVQVLRAVIPKSVNMDWQCPAVRRAIWGDETQIHQLIMNLCLNASQAMGEDGGHLTLALSDCVVTAATKFTQQSLTPGSYVLLEVSDTGCGMPAGVIAQIFKPSFTTKSATGGTGLGLFIVDQIVRAHRGSVHVESAPGKGTTMYIYLPHANEESGIEKANDRF